MSLPQPARCERPARAASRLLLISHRSHHTRFPTPPAAAQQPHSQSAKRRAARRAARDMLNAIQPSANRSDLEWAKTNLNEKQELPMASAAPIISLISGALALVGLAFGHFGIVSPMAGFQTFLAGTLLGGLFSVVLSLVGLFLSRGGRDVIGRNRALVGLAVGLGLLIIVLAAASTGGDAPPINDISTDLENPPSFAEANVVADYAGRDMGYPADFKTIVRAEYPTLAPLRLTGSPAQTFSKALATAESLGWEIAAYDSARGQFDAQSTSSLFRFVDDITVRVQPDGNGTRVDMRSKSRDGRSDLGANAKRIRAFFEALKG